MKTLLLMASLLLVGQQSDKNPDLELKRRDDLDPYADVSILKNLSTSKVYTVTVRQREFRKRYRVYQLGHEMPDTVVVKRDTLVRFADVVVPPRKWRYLGVTFQGESVGMYDQRMKTDTGHVSTYKFKIMASKLGGDVKQVYDKPEPFAVTQPSSALFYAMGINNFYDKYIRSIP
jgi:hypothetical protein